MREEYLDGLRGWAALIVVMYHTCLMMGLNLGMSFKPIVMDGPFSVFIFFVLSGYVLSVAAFKSGDRRIVVDMAIRRYPRLTVPILCISAVALVLMLSGAMHNVGAAKVTGSELWMSQFYVFDGSLLDMLHFSLWRVYTDHPAPTYNSSLWTMPYELQGSLLVFALLLSVGRSSTARLLGHVVFIAATWWFTSFIFAMALGVALGNFVHLRVHRRLCTAVFSRPIAWALILGGLLAAAVRPEANGVVWTSLCALAVVYGVLLDTGVQRVLTAPVSLWLGRISFPLYLVHIPLICSAASWACLVVADAGWMGPSAKVALAVLTVGVSLVAATVFAPVERLAVALGRRLSRAVIESRPVNRFFPAMVRR